MTSDDDFTPCTDELVAHNGVFASDFHDGALQVAPTLRLAVVACMDSRMDIFKILGLNNGEAHIIRNAGGVVTDDVIRSLCLSQRALGTHEIVLMHHTNCGLHGLNEDAFKADLEQEVGVRPTWSLGSFDDPFDDVALSIKLLEVSPFLRHTDAIRGFVYDVTTGRLDEVNPPSTLPAPR